MKTLISLLSATLCLVLFTQAGWAQSATYKLNDSSTMVIKGTSTIHDWEATVEKLDASVSLNPALLEQEPVASPVESFSLSVPVKSIESGKGGMNKKIYGALKEKKHPDILFSMKSSELTDKAEDGSSFTLKVTGNLNIAGFLKEITFPVKGTKVNDHSFRFGGSYGIDMEDYNVKPPSAIFGTIKSGKDVEVVFNVLFSQVQS